MERRPVAASPAGVDSAVEAADCGTAGALDWRDIAMGNERGDSPMSWRPPLSFAILFALLNHRHSL